MHPRSPHSLDLSSGLNYARTYITTCWKHFIECVSIFMCFCWSHGLHMCTIYFSAVGNIEFLVWQNNVFSTEKSRQEWFENRKRQIVVSIFSMEEVSAGFPVRKFWIIWHLLCRLLAGQVRRVCHWWWIKVWTRTRDRFVHSIARIISSLVANLP